MRAPRFAACSIMIFQSGLVLRVGFSVLVQSGDNAIKSTAAMGDFTIIDQSDQSPLRAGLFAIDAIDHIKFRFLEQVDPHNNIVYVRHSPDDKGGFTTDISSINIIGRAFWKLCLI
ncbi:MAG: hypothetical protein ACPF94_09745 [Candidatus Puniceispirillales bacterium]